MKDKVHALEDLLALLDTRSLALPSNKSNVYENLLDQIGDARYVLMGEATHGTQEFYQIRMDISRELITKKGFMAIVIEADWPSAYQINRYIRQTNNNDDLDEVLNNFKRFPRWMWRNTQMPPFLKWLREYNKNLTHKIGFYGLDLYSLEASLEAVISYLEKVDPAAAKLAKERYACFDHLNLDPQAYGYLTSMGLKESCIKQAVEQLNDLQKNAMTYIQKNDEDEFFYATQNARLVKNAEAYYREHFGEQVSSWNIRDKHMAETVEALSLHLQNIFKKPPKIIIWAHNSHVGDARATEMNQRGEINLGQLLREKYPSECYLLGFSTYQGTVTAASEWDTPAHNKKLQIGMKGSYEDLFHQVKHGDFLLNLKKDEQLEHFLKISRLQRAVGVIYRPESERLSHYFYTNLPQQFDSIIHIDNTTALTPLS